MDSFVSGTYRGPQTSPDAGLFGINLRVDVDRIRDHSIVTHTLSGDFFRNSSGSRSFLYSWVARNLAIEEHPQHLTATGAVSTTHSASAIASVKVRINSDPARSDHSATVTFTRQDGTESIYDCIRESTWFREVTLEIDVCKSVRPPRIRLPKGILPTYDTHSISTRPSTLLKRKLSPQTALADAGIELSIAKTSTVINDTAPQFKTWSDAELHERIAKSFKQTQVGSAAWPKWHMWGLVAGKHDNSAYRGIMFDFSGTTLRQGFAVFADHPELKKALARGASDKIDPVAARMLLHVMVHEAAHTFNLRHAAGTATSWMNEVFKPTESTTTAYWKRFPFSFPREELLHLRHGEFLDVVMGGNINDPVLEDPSAFLSTPEVVGRARWSIDIRSQGFFELMEPIEIELRIKNCSRTKSITIDGPLIPESGSVLVLIRRPNGSVVQYRPLACYCPSASGESKLVLAPCAARFSGRDRISQLLDLTSGASGFLFDAPGKYEIRIVYHSSDQVDTSAVHCIRVGIPISRKIDVLAQDYFSSDNALSLALGVSRARSLSGAFRLLESIVHGEFGGADDSPGLVTKLARRMARALGRPFHEEVGRGKKKKFQVTGEQKVDAAIQMIESTLCRYKAFPRKGMKAHNLAYEKTAAAGIRLAKENGDEEYVKFAVKDLLATLKSNGVRDSVCKKIRLQLFEPSGQK